MHIVYHRSSYISHRTAADAYIDCLLGLGHKVSFDPADAVSADAVILHQEPTVFPALFERYPALHASRVIAYCVWESESLPDAYARPLSLAREIWTPSEFSRRALARCPAKVSVLPHVVCRAKAAAADMAAMRERLAPVRDGFRFYSIIDSANPRKNLVGLLSLFAAVRRSLDKKIYLVIKLYRGRWLGEPQPGVLFLEDELGEGEMAALHSQCDAYVSAHHAEGWGLGLSAAMAFGRPLIATGWSGNMDFMEEGGSFPIPYTLVPVSEVMCRALPLFTRDMRWAEPDSWAFAEAMRRVALGRISPDLPARASAITARFGPEAVSRRLDELL